MSFPSEILAVSHEKSLKQANKPKKRQKQLSEVLRTRCCAEHFFRPFSGVLQHVSLERLVQLEFQWRHLLLGKTWNMLKNAASFFQL